MAVDNKRYGLSVLDRDLIDLSIDEKVLEILKPQEALSNMILPWCIDTTGVAKTLRVFASDVSALKKEQDLLSRTKGEANKLDVTFATENKLREAITHFYNIEEKGIIPTANNIDVSIVEEQDDDDENPLDEHLEDENSPMVKLVNAIITTAIEKKASDIHFEPESNKGGMKIRFRIDGTLIPQDAFHVSDKGKATVIARIKIMAKMDVAKKRDAQDGQLSMKINQNLVDFRVNILPTVNGEKCVLRVLDKTTSLLDLEHMGFHEEDLKIFNQVINDPTGVILVTGPTGSGKTTSLYGFLEKINATTRNITTIENPVEYQLDGINQIQVDEKHIHFKDALRAILRQDPDVIMIGEVRDNETAENMVQSAQTGHLVFSTLHTNDALSVLNRLKRLGIEEDAISQSLSLVIAQRLVKKICQHCSTEYTPDFKSLGLTEHNLRYLKHKHEHFFHGRGCDYCDGTGYSGRIVVYEYFEVDDTLREMIEAGKSIYEIRRFLINERGMISMWHKGLDLVRNNITTIEEVRRAVKKSREEWKYN